MDIVNGVLIPALDDVGERFEVGTCFLLQLMAYAEMVSANFYAKGAAESARIAAEVLSWGKSA